MNGQNHGGKGSAQRPADQEKFETNWDKIFGEYKTDVSIKLQKYIAVMEPRDGMSEDVDAFIFEAINLSDAYQQIAFNDNLKGHEVYIQSASSLWLHNDIRKNKQH